MIASAAAPLRRCLNISPSTRQLLWGLGAVRSDGDGRAGRNQRAKVTGGNFCAQVTTHIETKHTDLYVYTLPDLCLQTTKTTVFEALSI
jgi:hypothetical protein